MASSLPPHRTTSRDLCKMLNRLVILLPLTATVALAAAASDVLAGRSLDLEERTFFPSNPYLSDPNNW